MSSVSDPVSKDAQLCIPVVDKYVTHKGRNQNLTKGGGSFFVHAGGRPKTHGTQESRFERYRWYVFEKYRKKDLKQNFRGRMTKGALRTFWVRQGFSLRKLGALLGVDNNTVLGQARRNLHAPLPRYLSKRLEDYICSGKWKNIKRRGAGGIQVKK